MDDHDAARELYLDAKRVQMDMKGGDPTNQLLLGRIYVGLAGLSMSSGEHSKAVEESEAALSIEVALRGPVHHCVAAIYNTLGSAQVHSGDYAKIYRHL